MTGPNTLKQELAAGFHSSVREVERPEVSMSDLGFYARGLNIDYGYIPTRHAIEEDDLGQEPIYEKAHHVDDNPANDEFIAAELMAEDDRVAFIAAESDARRAEFEAEAAIRRLDRFMMAAKLINQMELGDPEEEQGDK